MKEISLSQVTKTVWILIGIAFLLSLLTQNLSITLGIVIGSLLGLLNFKLLSLTTKKALSSNRTRLYISLSYVARLSFLGLILALILSIEAINSIAVLVGLSMIVLAIIIHGIVNTLLVFKSK